MANEDNGSVLALRRPCQNDPDIRGEKAHTLAISRIVNSRWIMLVLWSERMLLDMFPCSCEG